MRVITKPTVTVVSVPKFIEHPEYKVPQEKNDLVRLGAFAAKGCYASWGEDVGRSCIDNQRTILEHKHGSVLEHINISCYIEGITRALSLELNRHRTFSISQRSTRYTKEEDAAIVLDPYYAELYKKSNIRANSGIGENEEDELVWAHINASEDAIAEYAYEVKFLMQLNPYGLEGFALRKWARGKARNLLPHNLETQGTYTNNVRGWRWFIELRSQEGAEAEIRRLAVEVYRKLFQVAPLYFIDFNTVDEVEGIPVLVPNFSKI